MESGQASTKGAGKDKFANTMDKSLPAPTYSYASGFLTKKFETSDSVVGIPVCREGLRGSS